MNTIRIKVFPESKKEHVEHDKDTLRVFVRESAQRNMANKAVLRVLAVHLQIPEKTIRIIAGHRSQNKTIQLLPY